MSHFYGTLKGNRGQATRCGTKASGMETVCAGWDGAVSCQAYRRQNGNGTATNMVRITFKRWQGRGADLIVYDGPIDGSKFCDPTSGRGVYNVTN